jgi:hypothetical protein
MERSNKDEKQGGLFRPPGQITHYRRKPDTPRTAKSRRRPGLLGIARFPLGVVSPPMFFENIQRRFPHALWINTI